MILTLTLTPPLTLVTLHFRPTLTLPPSPHPSP